MKRNDIDALARLLDEGGAAETVAAPAETRALASLAAALESSAAPLTSRIGANAAGAPLLFAPTPDARPEFKNELRAMLVEAAREQASRPSVLGRLRERVDEATSRWRYSSSVAAATGATALALSSGGVALASEQALPGDVLYGVKLTLEDARLAMERNPVERAERRLAYATERIDEAEQVAVAGDHAAAAVALREAEEAARVAAGELIRASQETGDPRPLQILGDWTRENRPRIEDMGPFLDGPARIAFGDVLTALERIDERLAVLRDGATCVPRTAESVRASGATATASPGEFDFSAIPSADQPFTACPTGTEVAPAGDGSTTTTGSDKGGARDGQGAAKNGKKDAGAKDGGAKDGGAKAGGAKDTKGGDDGKKRGGGDDEGTQLPVVGDSPVDQEPVDAPVETTGGGEAPSDETTTPRTGDDGVDNTTDGATKKVDETVKKVEDGTSGGTGGGDGDDDPIGDVIEEVTNPKPPTVKTDGPLKPPSTLPTTPPAPDLGTGGTTGDTSGTVDDVEETVPDTGASLP